MNKETCMFCTDLMQFIVATMTKNYDKARDIANSILEAEPENTTLRSYLSVLERERNKRKRIHDDSDVSESDSEPSVDSNSDNTDSNSDNSTDTDDGTQNIADIEKKRDHIERKKNCQKFETRDLVIDGNKSNPSYDPSNRHNYKEINKVKFGHNDFKGKMIRVLPIRLSEKINLMRSD